MDCDYISLNNLGLNPFSYSIAIDLFVRLLGVIYVFVYIPFLWQIRGLLGEKGVCPINDYLSNVNAQAGNKRFYYVPTLLWLNSSDRCLIALIWIGILLGLALILGIWPPLILLLLYTTHVSLTSVGQEFLRFGWETFLIEITFASFLLTATHSLNYIGWISLNFLLFRFYFQAGASKLLSGDVNWRNLTAISYHYLTQPIPSVLAWYFHKFPMWFHKVSTVGMFYAELIVPLAIFAPPEIRCIVFLQLAALQLGIWGTGNFSYLNHLSIVLSIILIPNRILEPYLPIPHIREYSPQIGQIQIWQFFIYLIGSLFLFFQVCSLLEPFSRNRFFRRMMLWIEPFHLACPHGIFAVMTTKRLEIIVEGSDDGVIWKEYQFYHKPGDLKRRPHRISPFQPRIDWQAWFLPFSRFWNAYWFQKFLVKILQGEPSVLQLLKENPFPGNPPHFIRTMIYDYKYTTYQEKRETGAWWKRRLIGEYSPLIYLNNSDIQNSTFKNI